MNPCTNMATCEAIERKGCTIEVTVMADQLEEAVRAVRQMVEMGVRPPEIVVKQKQATAPSGNIYVFYWAEFIFDE
jgi:hypothetical protein